jgi:hypothetical protein
MKGESAVRYRRNTEMHDPIKPSKNYTLFDHRVFRVPLIAGDWSGAVLIKRYDRGAVSFMVVSDAGFRFHFDCRTVVSLLMNVD